jgi:hypothetical protein
MASACRGRSLAWFRDKTALITVGARVDARRAYASRNPMLAGRKRPQPQA